MNIRTHANFVFFLDSLDPKTSKSTKNRKSEICAITKITHTYYDKELKTIDVSDILKNCFILLLRSLKNRNSCISDILQHYIILNFVIPLHIMYHLGFLFLFTMNVSTVINFHFTFVYF